MRQLRQMCSQRTLAFCVLIALGLTASATQAQTGSRAHLIEPAAANQIDYTMGWSYAVALAPGNRIRTATVLDEMVLVVEEPRNVLTAVSVHTGQRLWKRQLRRTNSPLYEPRLIGDSVVINSTGQVFVLDAHDGELLAQFDLPYAVRSAPAVAGRYGFFGGGVNVAFAMDLATGSILWRNHVGSPVHTSPVISGNGVLVATLNGRYTMLDLQTGDRIWTRHAFNSIEAGIASDGQTMFIPSRDFSMYMANPVDGRDRFEPYRTESPLTEPATVLDDAVYLPLPGIGLAAIDTETGRERWVFDEPAKPITTTRRGHLLSGLADGLIVIDARTGRVISDAATQPLLTAIAGPEHSAILISPRGRMLRLNPRR